MEFKIVKPSMHYRQSYHDYLTELGNEERYPMPMDLDHRDFPALLQTLNNYEQGVDLPHQRVPNTTLWLIHNSELVGVANIRHRLNRVLAEAGGHIGIGIRPSYRKQGAGAYLMQASVNRANSMNISPIQIHCYADNPASQKLIEKCGGELTSQIVIKNATVLRFNINRLAASANSL